MEKKKGFSCRKPPLHPRLGSNRLWISDQMRSSKNDMHVKTMAGIFATMVKGRYNLHENWSNDYTLDLAEFVVNKVRATPSDKRCEYDDRPYEDSPNHPFPFPEDSPSRLVYDSGRSFPLIVQLACEFKQLWWPHGFTHDLVQLAVMKLQSSTKPLDADALPSKKKLKSVSLS